MPEVYWQRPAIFSQDYVHDLTSLFTNLDCPPNVWRRTQALPEAKVGLLDVKAHLFRGACLRGAINRRDAESVSARR
jgi:hypothetical protein